MKTTIAVDPGASGGVAFSNEEDGIYATINLNPLTTLLGEIEILRNAGHEMEMVVEDIPPYVQGNNIPGSSAFKMGVSFGLIQGIALGERIPCFLVRPKDWQKHLIGKNGPKGPERKRALRDIAKELYPELKPTLKTCDAILLLFTYLDAKNKGIQ